MIFNTKAVLFSLLLLLQLFDTINGQDDNNNNCVSLGNSQVCSAFSQFYVGLPGLASNYPFLLNTTTIEEFDQRLIQYVNSTSNYLFPLGCLSTNYNPTIPYARYSLTRLCAAMIQDPVYSLPCNFHNQLSPPPLCQQTCTQWVDSVTFITNNPRVCMDSAQRNTTLASFSNQCSTWEGFNGTAADNCIAGIANEPANCGFGVGNDRIACQYCSKNSSIDPCCQNVTGCSKALPAGAIVGIVIGCIVAVALITFAAFYYCFYKKKNRRWGQNTFQFMSSSSAAVSSASNTKEEDAGAGLEDEVPVLSPPTRAITATTITNKVQINNEDADMIIPSTTQTPINEEFYVVIHPYPPQMADELELNPGDIVCLALHFDDGWALGFNVTTNKKGAFPTVCVIPIPEESLDQLLNQPAVENYRASVASKSFEEESSPQASNNNKKKSLSLNTNYHSIHQENNNSIPKRSASYKSNYDYIEAESPSSPTFHTPFFTSSSTTTTTNNNSFTSSSANNNPQQQQQHPPTNQDNHYEMK